jgi:hypothetical protein
MKKTILAITILALLIAVPIQPRTGNASTFSLLAKNGCGFITLSWDKVDNVKGYFLYRGIGSGKQVAEPLTDFPIKETTYKDDNDIEKGVQYCYVVKAVGMDLKEFASSNEACAKSLCPEDCTLELRFKIGSKTFWKNGTAQPEMSSAPIMQWNRSFLLIRYVAEAIGAKVDWDANTKTVIITTKDSRVIKLTVGKNKGLVNGKETSIDANNSKVTPIIVNGRTLCPLRFTGYNLGATGPDDILWDPDTQTAILKFKNAGCENDDGGQTGGGGGGGSGTGGGGGTGSGGMGATGSDVVPDDTQILPGSPKSASGTYSDPKGNPEKTWNFGSGIGVSWIPIQGGGGDYKKHVSFSNGAMLVNAPEGSSWAKSGVRSKEPYFVVPSDNSPYSILVETDPAKTTGFVVALSDRASTEDPWNGTNVWIYFAQSPNASQAVFGMANLINSKDTKKSLTDIDTAAPSKLLVTAKGTSVSVCASSGYSLTGSYSWLKPGTKVYLYVFSSSIDGGGQPVKFGLKSVRGFKAAGCVDHPYTPAYNNLVYTEGFNSHNQTMWQPLATAGGDFAKFAKFENGAFSTNVPKNNSWGKTGLKSKYYFLEVTKEMELLPYTLVIETNPAKTSAFVFALSTINSTQDPWNVESVWVSHLRHEYGSMTSFYMSNQGNEKDPRISEDTLPPNLPSKIALTISPGKVKLVNSLGYSTTANYPFLKAGTKLFLYVFNHGFIDGMPSSMSLDAIKIYRHKGADVAKWNPKTNLVRFVEDFKSGDRGGMWQPLATAGGDFTKFARYENGAFAVNVPAGNSWGKTGIKTEHFMLPISSQPTSNPYVIEFELDPSRSKGFRLCLTDNNSTQDPWNVQCLWTGFSVDEKTNKGSYYFQDNPARNTISKVAENLAPTSPSWVRISVKAGWMKVETSLGQVFEGNFAWCKGGTNLFLYAFTHPFIDGQPSSMCIKKIVVRR